VKRGARASLIQRLLWTPLKPGQIRILSLRVLRASGLLGLALFPSGVFLTPLDLFRFLTVSFCDGCFSCSSDGALLCVATRIQSPHACCVYGSVSFKGKIRMALLFHDVFCCLSQKLVQPCANECPGRTHGLPCSRLADGCLP